MNKEVAKKNALKVLEQQYDSFIDIQDKWDFFRGLANYTNTLETLNVTRPLVEVMEKQQNASRMLIETLNINATKELSKTAASLNELAKHASTPNNALKEAFDNIQQLNNITTSNPLAETMETLRKTQAT